MSPGSHVLLAPVDGAGAYGRWRPLRQCWCWCWWGTLALALAVLLSAPLGASGAKAKDAEPTIEDVGGKQLERILDSQDYVAVYWYTKNCKQCDKVLGELEKIDDDTDHFGVDFVRINDKRMAKQFGITTFPSLTYFRDKAPILYEGDLMDEDSVLDFLTSLEAMAFPDRIEEVNSKSLDKIVETKPYVAVLFYKAGCRRCERALKELENIDDEADELGIGFVKIADEELAEEFSLGSLPALVYYRRRTPIVYEGDLTKEEEVLEWLVTNKSTGDEDDFIEEVSAKALDTLATSIDHLAVLFFEEDDVDSSTVLAELEKIDDECDSHGIQVVKVSDAEAAEQFGIHEMPALVYFEHEIPNVYIGDLKDEEAVLHWLVHQTEADEIEDVTDEMLDKLIRESHHLAVFFYNEDEPNSEDALKELENIDDECDKMGIVFVKIDNDEEAKEYGIDTVPTLVYFEHSIPSVYDGDLRTEEDVLAWLKHQLENDEIEEVTDEMLDMLIQRSKALAVLFYDKGDKRCLKILEELEKIDDECDSHGIVFVKLDNDQEVEEYGLQVPSLVYFENKIPHLYEGELMDEDAILEWLMHQMKHDEIEEVTDEMLDLLITHNLYVAALFYDKDDRQDLRILDELEQIDDECDHHDIIFVKIDNDEEAKEYGFENLPILVFFENKIPSIYEGNLNDEESVLRWLVDQRESATIPEVTDEILETLVDEHEYVVVYFSGPCEEGKGHRCDAILGGLEEIDDEADDHGIHVVTTEDTELGKRIGVKEFPALVFFRNRDPLLFDGDLDDEDEVLAWVTDEDNLEIEDRIEEVNLRMLQKILDTTPMVAVFFYKEADKKSTKILHELENIDDECDHYDISFVKISDEGIAEEYELETLPALVFFKDKFPQIYRGDLMEEDSILKWLIESKDRPLDQIEEVDHHTLKMLLDELDHVAVLFYDENDKDDDVQAILEELETIDDEADSAGVHFVKTNDHKAIDSHFLEDLPALVYYDAGVPTVFEGDVGDEEEVLTWLLSQKRHEVLPDLDRDDLEDMLASTDFLALFFYSEGCDDCTRALRHLEIISTEVREYGIRMAKMDNPLIAKKYGTREPPGMVYFRKGKSVRYEGDIQDDEEILEWLTDPENMELTDSIEKVNRKMFDKIRESSDYLAAIFYSESDCKQCEAVLVELEHIDDDAESAGIDFVKVDDRELSKQFGVFALPAVLFFRAGSEEPVIYAGDLKDENRLLEWLMVQQDPHSDVIDEVNGEELKLLVETTESVAVYFWNKTFCDVCLREERRRMREGIELTEEDEDQRAECGTCTGILEDLENIDDDADRHGVHFVKTQDLEFAEEFGVKDFPAIVYFEHGVPNMYEGELQAEEDVLQWLILQKTEDQIELVTRPMLEQMVEEIHYLAVFFYKEQCRACEQVLEELEKIDDECDVYGIQMVKIPDPPMAKRYGIKTFPALVYFRNGNPLIYEGDLKNEASVLEWLTDDENRELADEIEAVNDRMLDKLLDESPFLAVFFYDEDECEDCEDLLEELEKIDDEADMYGINFVKVSNPEAAKDYGIIQLPALAYFRRRTPLIYDGDLDDEQSLLAWLTSQDVFELKDEIEEVNRKMLDKLLDENDFVAVYFYEPNCAQCDEILEELEHIDSETDALDITFVKIRDVKYARKYGVNKLPALLYFRRKFPSIYRGNLMREEEVLDWLQKNRFKHPELNLFMYALGAISLAFVLYTVFLLFCFRQQQSHLATTQHTHAKAA